MFKYLIIVYYIIKKDKQSNSNVNSASINKIENGASTTYVISQTNDNNNFKNFSLQKKEFNSQYNHNNTELNKDKIINNLNNTKENTNNNASSSNQISNYLKTNSTKANNNNKPISKISKKPDLLNFCSSISKKSNKKPKNNNKNNPSIDNLRQYMENKEKDFKTPQAKNEAVNILKNMNIDNTSALDNLFFKNNKVLDKITNIDEDENEDEIIYPSIDRNNIDSFYLKAYDDVINFIKKHFKEKNCFPDTNLSFYKYGKQLGRGAFGKVNLGIHILTGRPVAIKSFKLADAEINSVKRRLHLETQLMKTLNHPNILRMYETFETQKYLMISTEYIPGGDLLSFLRNGKKLNESTVKYLFKQLLEALKYMHSQDIIHRDVKLDNILIDVDSTIKLCDFGVSKLIRAGETMSEQCGTPAYIAPEIYCGEHYTGFGADMWSAGVVLYVLLSGTMPFKANNMDDLQSLIISANYNDLNDVSKDAAMLISELLEVDPKKRLTAEEALKKPFLRDARKKMK